MQTIAGIPYEIVSIVIAAIIFFVAIQYVIGLLFKTKKAQAIQRDTKTADTDSDSAVADSTKTQGGQN